MKEKKLGQPKQLEGNIWWVTRDSATWHGLNLLQIVFSKKTDGGAAYLGTTWKRNPEKNKGKGEGGREKVEEFIHMMNLA